MAVNLESLVRERAQGFAEAIGDVARRARTEEEIRIAVERELARFCDAARDVLGDEPRLHLDGRHEFTLATGRIDSLYDRVIIEYKNPSAPAAQIGASLQTAGTQRVVDQILGRFQSSEAAPAQVRALTLGIGLDGRNIVFVRKRGEEIEVDEPQPFDADGAARFLWAIFNLGTSGRAFTAQFLAEDFGASSGSVRNAIRRIYECTASLTSARSQLLFKQWQLLFGEVCGFDLDTASAAVRSLARAYEIPQAKLSAKRLLFSVHTYYALFMKLLAGEIIAFYHTLPRPVQRLRRTRTPNTLFREFQALEAGGLFRNLGISNFLEGDLFSWYAHEMPDALTLPLRELLDTLSQYNPGSLADNPAASRDMLKGLYEGLFPREVRHALGEYYTPDWLAQQLLDSAEYRGDPRRRLLDPACGSGTFLVEAINRCRRWWREHRDAEGLREDEFLRLLLQNIVGFDLNPVAVLAARTNYVIAIRDLIIHGENVEIPVFLTDSVATPVRAEPTLFDSPTSRFKTTAGRFEVPTEVIKQQLVLGRYATVLEDAVQNHRSADDFISRCEEAGVPVEDRTAHITLFEKLLALHRQDRNGVWARLIKNAFAPVFAGQFDFVVGNPPWIRWGYLPEEYREDTKDIWEAYGLFSLKGFEARLGSGEKDFSQLFTYVCIDKYLADSGVLAFLITATVFKAGGQAEGFRRFRLGERGPHIRILAAHDLTALRPFPGASNLTAFFVAKKGEPTRYPVPYTLWLPNGWNSIPEHEPLEKVLRMTARQALTAQPVGGKDRPASRWLTAAPSEQDLVAKMVGRSDLRPITGARVEPYGVYMVRVLKKLTHQLLLVENVHDAGKKKMRVVQMPIEPHYLHPLVRGRDVERWFHRAPVLGLVVQDPETQRGILPAVLRKKAPKTLAYLEEFRDVLAARAAYRKYHESIGAPFYSMFNISADTFADWRVAWRRMGNEMRACVLASSIQSDAGDRQPIPTDTVTMLAVPSEAAADYVVGLLNSAPLRAALYTFSQGGRGLGSPSIFKGLRISPFDAGSHRHASIAKAARQLRKLYATAEVPSADLVATLESQIDVLVSQEYGLTSSELASARVMAEARSTSKAPAKRGRDRSLLDALGEAVEDPLDDL